MKIGRVDYASFGEGPRQNTTIWVSGCSIRCPGCFNPHLWESSYGVDFTVSFLIDLIQKGIPCGDTGIAVVGGEPFDQVEELYELFLQVKQYLPLHKITVYSGYIFENLLNDKNRPLKLSDYLVDGPFIIKEKLAGGYRGSTNQRVIDVQESFLLGVTKTLDWDNLVVVTKNTIVTPIFMSLEGGSGANQCGFDNKLDPVIRDSKC